MRNLSFAPNDTPSLCEEQEELFLQDLEDTDEATAFERLGSRAAMLSDEEVCEIEDHFFGQN